MMLSLRRVISIAYQSRKTALASSLWPMVAKTTKQHHSFIKSQRAFWNYVSSTTTLFHDYALNASCCQTRSFTSSTSGSHSTTPANSQPKAATGKFSDFRRILSLARPEAKHLTAAFGLLCITSAVTGAIPLGFSKIIDVVLADPNAATKLVEISELLGAVFVLGAAANYGRVYLSQMSAQRIISRLRNALFTSMLRQEISFFDKAQTGELINRLSADTAIVGRAVTDNIGDGLRGLSLAAIGSAMMFVMSPKLALFVLGIVPPVIITAVIFGRFVRKISRSVQDKLAEANHVAEEKLSAIRTVRAFAAEFRESARYATKVDEITNLVRKEAIGRGAFHSITQMVGNFIMLGVLWQGGHMMMQGELTAGNLTAFLLYTVYVGIAVAQMSNVYGEAMKAAGAGGRVFEIIDRKPAPAGAALLLPEPAALVAGATALPSLARGPQEVIPAEEFRGKICLENVSFTYPTRPESLVLDSVSLEVPEGTSVAIVGPSGSGKTTLAALLLRFYDPDQGRITIDGRDLKDLRPDWLRSVVGYVSQSPDLFSESVFDNIAYGVPNATREAVVEAARLANADQFIAAFPQGYDTAVGERGHAVSGGQRQRIAIARAILKNPKILLLDEATSALDAESEYLVQEALERLMAGRTVVIIAHRLSTIKKANKIVMLDKGKIAESGNFGELMQRKHSLFKRLVERQTEFAK